MTVYSFLKYAFIFVSLMGFAFICVGAWKIWSSYNFAKTAEVKQGIFQGYHIRRTQATTRDNADDLEYRMIEEYLPMFSYTDDSGQRHDITGTDGHFFRHLKNKVNEPVTVLVSPDNSANARLGDALSLYSSGALMGLAGLIFFLLPLYGANLIGSRISQTAAALTENQEAVLSLLDRFGQSHLPVSDIVILLGGFFLIAGGVMGYAYYFFSKRQNTGLIEAIQNHNYNHALVLAAKGIGVDGKNSDGETALIAAIKAGQPDIACAIINNLWVNTHAETADGNVAVHLAAFNGDSRTLSLLLKKGEMVSDVKPEAIYHLIGKGNTQTLEVLIDNGIYLDQTYAGPTYGDQAVFEGQADIVQLIQKHNGLFKAPAAFIALALNDAEALRPALKASKAAGEKFMGLTLEKFAEKINRTGLLNQAKEL